MHVAIENRTKKRTEVDRGAPAEKVLQLGVQGLAIELAVEVRFRLMLLLLRLRAYVRGQVSEGTDGIEGAPD